MPYFTKATKDPKGDHNFDHYSHRLRGKRRDAPTFSRGVLILIEVVLLRKDATSISQKLKDLQQPKTTLNSTHRNLQK